MPAVDIRGGLCVNLVQGDWGRETVFSKDPVAQARLWRDQGAELVHIVDLDGAKSGRLCVETELKAIGAIQVPFEVGGGVRDMETVRVVFNSGAARVILGTAAQRDLNLVTVACRAFPGRVAVAIDARNGKVAVCGWLETTDVDAVEFAQRVRAAGAARVIYTDILCDGMMSGPNIESTRAVAQAAGVPVTASGGVSSLDDVRRLAELEPEGVDEVIVGRALYLGTFTLGEAIAAAESP